MGKNVSTRPANTVMGTAKASTSASAATTASKATSAAVRRVEAAADYSPPCTRTQKERFERRQKGEHADSRGENPKTSVLTDLVNLALRDRGTAARKKPIAAVRKIKTRVLRGLSILVKRCLTSVVVNIKKKHNIRQANALTGTGNATTSATAVRTINKATTVAKYRRGDAATHPPPCTRSQKERFERRQKGEHADSRGENPKTSVLTDLVNLALRDRGTAARKKPIAAVRKIKTRVLRGLSILVKRCLTSVVVNIKKKHNIRQANALTGTGNATTSATAVRTINKATTVAKYRRGDAATHPPPCTRSQKERFERRQKGEHADPRGENPKTSVLTDLVNLALRDRGTAARKKPIAAVRKIKTRVLRGLSILVKRCLTSVVVNIKKKHNIRQANALTGTGNATTSATAVRTINKATTVAKYRRGDAATHPPPCTRSQKERFERRQKGEHADPRGENPKTSVLTDLVNLALRDRGTAARKKPIAAVRKIKTRVLRGLSILVKRCLTSVVVNIKKKHNIRQANALTGTGNATTSATAVRTINKATTVAKYRRGDAATHPPPCTRSQKERFERRQKGEHADPRGENPKTSVLTDLVNLALRDRGTAARKKPIAAVRKIKTRVLRGLSILVKRCLTSVVVNIKKKHNIRQANALTGTGNATTSATAVRTINKATTVAKYRRGDAATHPPPCTRSQKERFERRQKGEHADPRGENPKTSVLTDLVNLALRDRGTAARKKPIAAVRKIKTRVLRGLSILVKRCLTSVVVKIRKKHNIRHANALTGIGNATTSATAVRTINKATTVAKYRRGDAATHPPPCTRSQKERFKKRQMEEQHAKPLHGNQLLRMPRYESLETSVFMHLVNLTLRDSGETAWKGPIGAAQMMKTKAPAAAWLAPGTCTPELQFLKMACLFQGCPRKHRPKLAVWRLRWP
ncbi:hypothetical protein V5799_020771 [Amblyomma americanum]|uniref:Uncharacterized protein n=1 Tax=Amblyomma americanum TaxID=6943 RepID=A0AAQ4ESX3_AMBAM